MMNIHSEKNNYEDEIVKDYNRCMGDICRMTRLI
jgi:hypothetical protein